MQMICALLVHGTPNLPAPLFELSPWLDHRIEPIDHVVQRLSAQSHRRIIKTHTPLDGIPLDARATYIVVARHPLDAAVSLYHQGANIDRARLAALTGEPPISAEAPPQRPSLEQWLDAWIDRNWHRTADDTGTVQANGLDTLPGFVWHIADAWARSRPAKTDQEPAIMMVHYEDLSTDLDTAMTALAEQLNIMIDPEVWPNLVAAARFDAMAQKADQLALDQLGVLRDRRRFFRQGNIGEGTATLNPAALQRYRQRTTVLASPELLTWLHRDRY